MSALRVQVPLVVEVDRDAWALNLGTSDRTADIVADIRSYVLTAVQHALSGLELVAHAEVKR